MSSRRAKISGCYCCCFTRSHQTSPEEKTIDHLWPSTDSIRKPLKSSATVFGKVRLIRSCWAWCFSIAPSCGGVFRTRVFCVILFSIHYIESSQIAAVEYLRLSAYIPRGLASALFIHTDREELKRKHETIKPPGAVSPQPFLFNLFLFIRSGCVVCWLLQQTILKHARVRSDEFGGRHRVTSRLCASKYFSFLFLPFLDECGVCVTV